LFELFSDFILSLFGVLHITVAHFSVLDHFVVTVEGLRKHLGAVVLEFLEDFLSLVLGHLSLLDDAWFVD
jgi:hypothetical protein